MYLLLIHLWYRDPRAQRSLSVLPSRFKRKRPVRETSVAAKRAKVTVWNRDVICLPKSCARGSRYVCFPRGKYRAVLGKVGLIGKVRITSEMTPSEVLNEIRSAFWAQMNNKEDFQFEFLQPTGCGSYALTIPNVSQQFSWSSQQVAKLSTTKGTIYILAKEKLTVDDEVSI